MHLTEYILILRKLTMALKIIKEEPAEASFTIRYLESNDERKQLANIFREIGMKEVEAEPFGKNCVELIAVDRESKKVMGEAICLLEDFKRAEIFIAVSLKNRKQGIGTALLAESEEILKELGIKVAGILPRSKGAYEFLAKNDYQYVGHVKEEVGGRFVAAPMEKRL